MICETCKTNILLHADASLHCSCDGVDYQPARGQWPEGWGERNEQEYLETLQAREILRSHLTESDFADQDVWEYIFDAVDERDLMRHAGGNVEKAAALARLAMETEEAAK